MMRVLAGTSGYAYKEWKGHFYPEKLPAKDMLRYYSSRFKTVEINNTFYRMPTEKTLLSWAGEVEPGFTFVLKASQRITHQKRLREAKEELSYFMRTATVLGKGLGPTLFQLPPNLKKDAGRLEEFLQLLPPTWRAAFEFRHPSWFDDEIYALLRSRGAVLCAADTGEEGDAPLVPTSGWGYLRLRREAYSPEELGTWSGRIRSQPWEEVFVFFKHEDEATGPRLAARFMEIHGGG